MEGWGGGAERDDYWQNITLEDAMYFAENFEEDPGSGKEANISFRENYLLPSGGHRVFVLQPGKQSPC